MKRKELLTLLGSICLVLVLAASALMAACAAPTPAPAPAPTPAPEPIELQALTFLPTHLSKIDYFRLLGDKVSERSNGELTIKLAGGPEVINEFEQGTAVKSGVIDISWLPGAFVAPLVPPMEMQWLSELSPQD